MITGLYCFRNSKGHRRANNPYLLRLISSNYLDATKHLTQQQSGRSQYISGSLRSTDYLVQYTTFVFLHSLSECTTLVIWLIVQFFSPWGAGLLLQWYIQVHTFLWWWWIVLVTADGCADICKCLFHGSVSWGSHIRGLTMYFSPR